LWYNVDILFRRFMKKHYQDTVLVYNPDLNCRDITSEVVRVRKVKKLNMPEGRIEQRAIYKEKIVEFDHREGFTVTWDGRPMTVPPGGKRVMPRYIAEHFARKLADHILRKRDDEENAKNRIKPEAQKEVHFINNAERTALMNEIIIETVQPFFGEPTKREGDKVEEEFRELNKGIVEKDKTDLSNLKLTDLHKECDKLGIDITKHESKQELIGKILAV